MGGERSLQVSRLLAVLLLAAAPARAEADLVLVDGRTLAGTAVEFAEGQFCLTTASGEVVPIPVELVKELRLHDRGRTEGEALPGVRAARPQVLAGPPEAVRPLKPAEALAVFRRPPARFWPSVVETAWRPSESWLSAAAAFHPVRWSKSVVDTAWRPVSAFPRDFTRFNPARWAKTIVRTDWQPTDGFRRPGWFGQAPAPVP